MSETKKPCCEDLVNELITNERTKFTEEDRENLLTMDESFLTKLIPNEIKKEEKPVEKKAEPKTQAKTEAPAKVKTVDEFIDTMPGELQDQVRSGLRLHQEQRSLMVKTILDNTAEGVWSEDDFKGMEMEALTKIYQTIPVEVSDYSLAAAGDNTSGPEGEVMLPAGRGKKKEDK